LSSAAEYDLEAVCARFRLPGKTSDIHPFGNGHINDTFRVVRAADGREYYYTLQRINQYVFKRPEEVMTNIERVTRHMRRRIRAQGGDPDSRVLRLVPTLEGRYHIVDAQGETWRIYVFIDGASMYEMAPNPQVLTAAAGAFGEFQLLLADLPGERLHETIPHFHDTPRRFSAFQDAVRQDAAGRASKVGQEIDFLLARESDAAVITSGLASGRLPERVTHNDTKINNVLIDPQGNALCVIDLDTVMPGSALYDFGDMVRGGAARSAEDEPDASLAGIRMDHFEALARGYGGAVRGMLTPDEWELMAFSARLITYEQAIRFLGDYLDGDLYYKTSRPHHNLDRARTQIAMIREMEERRAEMEHIVQACRAGELV